MNTVCWNLRNSVLLISFYQAASHHPIPHNYSTLQKQAFKVPLYMYTPTQPLDSSQFYRKGRTLWRFDTYWLAGKHAFNRVDHLMMLSSAGGKRMECAWESHDAQNKAAGFLLGETAHALLTHNILVDKKRQLIGSCHSYSTISWRFVDINFFLSSPKESDGGC